jgi:2-methylfumaryl-CoA hydratase
MNKFKPSQGHFFEDFSIGQELVHGVPRTITESDATLYLAFTGSRFALHCAQTIAAKVGFATMPLDNFLVFHIAFGKTVNDVSLNAIANLGYAELSFHRASFVGDTIAVTSRVIGLKENSNGKSGVVYVHSVATNQEQQIVLEWKRWVMVKKSDTSKVSGLASVPELASSVSTSQLAFSSSYDFSNWDSSDSDYQKYFNDFDPGEIINHPSGMTLNDSDHSLATRLYQNNARVHFDQAMMDATPAKKRLIYGGHIISICRALSYDGLSNGVWLASINGGTHCNPCYAGDTIYAQSRIIEKSDFEERSDIGLVRIQLIGTKNIKPNDIPVLFEKGNKRTQYDKSVVLDLDYSLFVIK